MKRIHEEFKNRISDELYEELEEEFAKIAENKDGLIIKLADKKMKKSIQYLRRCNLVKIILEDKNKSDVEKKLLTMYYAGLNSEKLEEVNFWGTGFYYDVKFEEYKETLYSVAYVQDDAEKESCEEKKSWKDWIPDKATENNKLKERGMQLIFIACKEHINRGGNIELYSCSKCFGIDLFKYMHLDEHGKTRISILKEVPINFIKLHDKKFSLQDYLLNDKECFDIAQKPQFCLDFSNPRGENQDNFNKWLKKFLEKLIISKKQEKDVQEKFSVDKFIAHYLINLGMQKEGNDKAIGSRVSPIRDKEVIVSDHIWERVEYTDDLNDEEAEPGKCYSFEFDEKEYYLLIYCYFKEYGYFKEYAVKDKDPKEKLKFEEKFMEKLKEAIKRMDKDEAYNNNKTEMELSKKDIEYLENMIGEPTKKIETLLNMIEWGKEEIPGEWTVKNIYNHNEKNNLINWFKWLCKSVIV